MKSYIIIQFWVVFLWFILSMEIFDRIICWWGVCVFDSLPFLWLTNFISFQNWKFELFKESILFIFVLKIIIPNVKPLLFYFSKEAFEKFEGSGKETGILCSMKSATFMRNYNNKNVHKLIWYKYFPSVF